MFNPSASRKKKLGHFLRSSKQAIEIETCFKQCEVFTSSKVNFEGIHALFELYVRWMFKPIVFYTWPGLIPKSATPIETMLAVFLIRCDQVTCSQTLAILRDFYFLCDHHSVKFVGKFSLDRSKQTKP